MFKPGDNQSTLLFYVKGCQGKGKEGENPREVMRQYDRPRDTEEWDRQVLFPEGNFFVILQINLSLERLGAQNDIKGLGGGGGFPPCLTTQLG